MSPGEGFLFPSLHHQAFSPKGVAGLSFTARIGRAPFIQMIPPSLPVFLSWNDTRAGPTAAVERAHSDRVRSGSKESARVLFHSFHRARSASKKGTWLLFPILPNSLVFLFTG